MFLDIPTNNTIGWQYLPETNALAYYKNPKIKDKKCFITLFINCNDNNSVEGVWPLKI
jgi:hypothetical protein